MLKTDKACIASNWISHYLNFHLWIIAHLSKHVSNLLRERYTPLLKMKAKRLTMYTFWLGCTFCPICCCQTLENISILFTQSVLCSPFSFYIFTFSTMVLYSLLHAAEATHSPSPFYYPFGGSHLRPECIRGTTHDCTWKKSTGQIQAAAG